MVKQIKCQKGCVLATPRTARDMEIALYEIDWDMEEREHMWRVHGWSKPSWVPAEESR